MSDESEDITSSAAMELYQAAVEEATVVAADLELVESTSTALVVTSTPEVIKKRLTDARVAVSNSQKKIVKAQKIYKDALERESNKAKAMLAEMEEKLAPVLAMKARMEDGIDAMNLYMGRDEFIVTIREGEKAPKESPIVIRQQVLAMDEESALNPLEGGMDAMDIELFDEWLLADPANVQQIIPEEKSVVVLRVRATAKNYKDPWQSVVMDAANAETWWLIRNGENLYRMVTEFNVGENLVPKSDEFTKLFHTKEFFGRTSEPIKPGTDEWIKAERQADAKTRHYMKIALILQGLVDRTEVFRPLPVDGLSVIEDKFYDEGYVRVVADNENTIASSLIPFSTWLTNANKKVGVGTRIILGRVYGQYSNESRVSPRNASAPDIHTPYVIKNKRSSDTWGISYPRNDEVWDEQEWGYRTAQTSASYYIYGSDHEHIAIDHVSVDEMETYLAARSQRKNYENMFPLLRAAIAFKKQEEVDEAPFRALLDAELDKAGYPETASELVHWFKTANKWNRPLMGTQEDEAKAARLIMAEAKRRNSANNDDSVVARLMEQYPDAMAILRGTTNYVVLIPELFKVAPKSAKENVFLRRIDVTKTGIVKDDKRWTTITKAQSARLSVLFKTAVWDEWKVGADENIHITQPEIDALFPLAKEYIESKYGEMVFAFVSDFGYGNATFEFYGVHNPVDLDAKLSLTSGFDSLSSQSYGVKIGKSKGVAFLASGYNNSKHYVSESTHWWRAKHNDFLNPTTDSGRYEVPWHNDEEYIMWVDNDLMERELTFAEHHKNRKIEFALLDAASDRLIDGIVEAWFAKYEKKMYARFIEDFGDDDDSWVEYRDKKKKSADFPYPATVQKWGGNRNRISNASSLRYFVMRLFEIGQPPYGLTVSDAHAKAQLLVTDVHGVVIPDDIKDLVFLDAE